MATTLPLRRYSDVVGLIVADPAPRLSRSLCASVKTRSSTIASCLPSWRSPPWAILPR